MSTGVSYWTYKTFNSQNKYTKRYVVYTFAWWWEGKNYNSNMHTVKRSNDYDEFDTIFEVQDYIKFLNEIYADVEQPYKVPECWVDRFNGNKVNKKPLYSSEYRYERHDAYWEAEDGKRKFWGYYVFDYKEQRVIDHGGVKHPEIDKVYKNDLQLRDALFRGKDEIPENYKWDVGEYEGWLQFRWGNGQNAIEKEDKINCLKKIEADRIREEKQNARKEFEDEFNNIEI